VAGHALPTRSEYFGRIEFRDNARIAVQAVRVFSFIRESAIAKQRNTYAKRQREQEKKSRIDKKRAKRDQKKSTHSVPLPELEPQPKSEQSR